MGGHNTEEGKAKKYEMDIYIIEESTRLAVENSLL